MVAVLGRGCEAMYASALTTIAFQQREPTFVLSLFDVPLVAIFPNAVQESLPYRYTLIHMKGFDKLVKAENLHDTFMKARLNTKAAKRRFLR